jgi:uncharacterized caspase-like protein
MTFGWPIARALLAFALLLVALGAPLRAEEARTLKGVALIIGQSKYAHIAPLANPGNDARAIVKLMSDLGFDARSVTDRDTTKLKRDVERFIEDAEGADVAFLYYSGHGIEAGGENYLIPVDADLASLGDAGEKLVPLSSILQQLKSTVPVTILLLDACRSNPFPAGTLVREEPGGEAVPLGTGGLGAPRGAAVVEDAPAPADSLGEIIGFAAEPGHAALDGEGSNSPYAAALLRHLAAMQGEEFGTVMRMVTEEVYLATRTRQRPWVNESLRRLLYFGVAPEPPTGEDGLITGERRQLLLTISELPSRERVQVETVAAKDGVPLDALYGVLRALGTSNIPNDPSELEKLLGAQADKLKQMIAERDALRTDDPEIARLTNAADRAIKEGAIATARQFLDEAVKRVEATQGAVDAAEEQVENKRLADAQIYVRRADASSLAFDYLAAANDYGKAFTLVEKWDEKLRWNYKNMEAEALNAYARATADRQSFARAIAAYETILGFIPHGEKNRDWAITSNNMAVVMQTLGERENSNVNLEKAAAIFTESLEVFAREKDDTNWAAAQNNLGNALLTLGMRENSSKQLEGAVQAFRAALEKRPRDKLPLDWASSHNNIGIALYTLAEREGSNERLIEAEKNYRLALEEFTREKSPVEWAMTQNNLGNTLNTLGTRLSDRGKLLAAAAAFRAAMEVRTKDQFPMQWAASQLNLGNTLNNIGRLEIMTATLEEAVAAYQAALTVFTRDLAPLEWASVQNNLGSVLQTIGQRTQSQSKLDESAAAFRAALSEYDRKKLPLDWAMAQNNLGNTLQLAGKLGDNLAKLNEAVAAHRSALSEYKRDVSPMQWAQVMMSLGSALEGLGFREQSTANLDESVKVRRAALEIITRENSPLEWATTMNAIGSSLVQLGNREQNKARFEEAKTVFEQALTVITRESQPLQWAFVQNNIGDVHWSLAALGGPEGYLDVAIEHYETAKAGFQDAYAFNLVALADQKINFIKENRQKK